MIRDETGIEAVPDHTGFYVRQDIDLVVNASFSHQHAAITRELLSHGSNVLSEKPAAKNESELETIVVAARANKRQFYIFQQYRFSPAFLKVCEVIDSGVLGRIVQISLYYDNFARRWDWQTVHAFSIR